MVLKKVQQVWPQKFWNRFQKQILPPGFVWLKHGFVKFGIENLGLVSKNLVVKQVSDLSWKK